jgi:hypothetical protein
MALSKGQGPEERLQRDDDALPSVDSALAPDDSALPPEGSVRGGGRFAWWGVFWLILIGLVIWWAGWGWGASGGWWWGQGARNRMAAEAQGSAAEAASAKTSGTGVEVLNAPNKRDFIGRPFQVNDVLVQGTANGKTLWIESNGSSPILTILKGPGNNVGDAIRAGELVNVTGTVEKAPPAAEAKSQWQLSQEDLNRLEEEGVYIQAMEVTNARR